MAQRVHRSHDLYAFGRRAQGAARAGSDLDLAILMPGYAQPLTLWNAVQALSSSNVSR
jgi:DNA polymerase sigma